jgi:membrane-associated phospholipid phosphatase
MGNKSSGKTEVKNSGTERKETNQTVVERTKHFWGKRLKKYWMEIVVLCIIGLCTALIHWLWEPFDSNFLERDPTLSRPYFADSEVQLPIPVIIFLAIALPIILTFVLQMTIRFWRRPDNIHPKAIDPFYGLLFLALAMAINGLFSEFLKSYVGKKRPNFFAMCNYKGYRDALAANNLTDYLANTDPNRFGSMQFCLDQSTFISWQSRSSYPSGHASYSFCGYTIFGLLCIYVWHCYTKKYKIGKVIFFMLCMIIAMVLSWGRARDYWHDYGDIYAGGVIGVVSGSMMFFVNFSFTTVDKLKKKLERELTSAKKNNNNDNSEREDTSENKFNL